MGLYMNESEWISPKSACVSFEKQPVFAQSCDNVAEGAFGALAYPPCSTRLTLDLLSGVLLSQPANAMTFNRSRAFTRSVALAAIGLLAACSSQSAPAATGADLGTYRLLRGSVADQLAPDPSKAPLRIHVATFDNAEGTTAQQDAVNGSNCDRAAALFMDQPGVTVRWWCERGRQ